jgi:hypothetical protein
VRTEQPEGDAGEDDVIEVLEAAWPTVQIYMACTWVQHLPMGATQLFFVGIAATEILAACALYRAPRAEWPLIVTRITQHMVPAARAEFNQTKKR